MVHFWVGYLCNKEYIHICASLDHTLIITCLFSLADDVDVYSFGYVWNLYGIILLDELLVACMNTFTLLEKCFCTFFFYCI
jgi:hypothetical protein